ncbi:hypothetical protein [Paludisphaera mucosa]|uniref:Uncharacterized protein n=1 Tax=Paludisphaera mucosa TaxID=3030827 RepID=A0ABT6FDL0_9BACT|nr:hypothetical protein [Paludisphaera mucosa]MDG3005673.1 hypothetical protein [Paludisphaera mucosa]
MDGEFACPECGQTVKVRRAGPGRQVRCEFCNSLLEVPFLPRVDGAWRRKRFERPRWVPWAWWGVALALMGIIATAAIQTLIRGERAGRTRAIERLIASSKAHEAEGRLDLALIDLDSALEVAPTTDVPVEAPEAIRERRRGLARRDVHQVLGKLKSDGRDSQSLGDWLNLVARVGADRDLAPVRKDVEARFVETLQLWIDDLAARAAREPNPTAALALCGEGADLAGHLSQPDRGLALERFRTIAANLVDRRGVAIDVVPGAYILGTPAGYERAFQAMIVEALRSKGYLAPPATARWRDLWSNPPYRFGYAIRESQEGTYLGTQNRLSRIEVQLALHDRGREIFKTTPHARTIVPVPGLPSYLAGRLALSQDRVDEAEKMLYDDAFSQVRDKFQHSLANLPACPAANPSASLGGR